MATSGRGTGLVGHNVQTAVDVEHPLIVAHEVTNVGNDRAELSKMARQARDASGHGGALTVIAGLAALIKGPLGAHANEHPADG